MKRGTTDRLNRRLEALVREAGAPDAAPGQLRVLIEALSAPEAPTTVHDPARIADVHLADSLEGLAVEDLARAREVADRGAGAGVPSLVLAAARPGVHVHVLESNRRKADFIAMI